MMPFSDCETDSILAAVASALDVSLPLERKSVTPDGYGHSVETWASIDSVQVNLTKPSATTLQAFAGIIGSQRALTIRAMQTSDIREGDRASYDGLKWLIHNVQNAESYTVTKEYLMAVIA